MVLAFGLTACPGPRPRAEIGLLKASAQVVEIHDGNSTERWTLSREQNPDVYATIVPPGRGHEVCFVSGDRSLCRTVARGEQIDFVIRHDGFDYPTRIVGVPPAAELDAAYQATHRGRIEVTIPEVYELVNIAIALTPTGRANPHLVARQEPYDGAVNAWFAPFREHPFIAAIDRELVAHHYFDIKMNAYAFEFGDDDRIIRSAVYDRTGFAGSSQNSLLPYLDSMQAFARASRFREFFRSQRNVYRAQEAYYRDSVGVAAMLDWLRARFPAVRSYDGFKIVFSPLVGGSQSVTWFESNGYRELQVHVNFPYPRAGEAGLSPAAVAFRRGEIVFTELNHGFINPAAEPYREAIGRTFADRAFWVKAGTSSDNYGNAMSIFLELMNWSLVALYAEDAAPGPDRERLIDELDGFMGDSGRGFSQFAPFKSELLRLYRSRPPGASVASLYPQILSWCAAHQAATATPR